MRVGNDSITKLPTRKTMDTKKLCLEVILRKLWAGPSVISFRESIITFHSQCITAIISNFLEESGLIDPNAFFEAC